MSEKSKLNEEIKAIKTELNERLSDQQRSLGYTVQNFQSSLISLADVADSVPEKHKAEFKRVQGEIEKCASSLMKIFKDM